MDLSHPCGPLCVLVVDDNRDAAQSLCWLLSAWGHRPLVAHDAASAWVTALSDRPDVVLLDLGLPGTDGWELARQVRAHPDLHRAVLLAITGHADYAHRVRSREVGIRKHLLKPVDSEVLRRLLEAYRPGGGGGPPSP